MSQDEDETTYMKGRVPNHTYGSTSFPLHRPGSDDDGAAAKFYYKVYDDDGFSSDIIRDGQEFHVCESAAGRVQTKLLVARTGDNVKDLWVQKLQGDGETQKVTTTLHLEGTNAQAFIELIQNLKHLPTTGGPTGRVDDALLKQALSDPDTLKSVYATQNSALRELIAADEDAADVLAIARRRREVQRFRAMLEEPGYFDEEMARRGVAGKEAVWQAFFEENPWVLGVGLAGQLLVSWNENRLEQTVAGASIGGEGKRSDAVLKTSGVIQSMVLAEIKHHETPLLKESPYRSGTWAPSDEVAGGVAQAQATASRAVETIGAHIRGRLDDGSEDPLDVTYLHQPRTFLIVGTLADLIGDGGGPHPERIRSFELFRRNTWAPEIVTFDELLARAEWMANRLPPDLRA